ncbi:MAG: aspartyl protease family protein [Gemmatimonadaceae bacterium]
MPTAARAIALLFLTVSCGGAGAPPQSAPSPATAPTGEAAASQSPAQRAAPADAASVVRAAGIALPSAFSRHHVFLRATVGGTPALLLFDSGASATIFTPRLVRRLGLAYRGRHVAYGLGEPVTGASSYDGAEIRIGALQVRPATVLSWADAGFPTYGGSLPDGVIGYDLLRSYVMVVDAAAGRVVAFDTTAPRAPSRRGAQTAALRVTNGLPVVDAEIFAGGHASADAPVSASLPVVVDFGAGAGLQLSRAAADRLRFPARLRDTRARQLVGIGGTVELPEGLADSLRIAGIVIPNALVATDTTQTPSVALAEADGFIGTEVLRRFVVTLDYARGRIVLEPNMLLRVPFCRNAAGLCIRTETALRGAEVVFVDPGSTGSRAGIRPGNLILAVDGTSLAQLPVAEIDRLLDRAASPVLEIVRSAAQLRALARPEPGPGRGARRSVVVRERTGELIRLPAP